MQAVAGNGTQAADAQTGAGERLTINHAAGQAQSLTHNADLILEQKLHRLYQLHGHVVGQTAHVVVGLDRLAGLLCLDGFQYVRVDCTLCQERNTVQLGGLLVEDLDELGTDDLALALGIGNTCQQIQEPVSSIYIDQVRIQTFPENLNHVFTFTLTHQAVVDMNAHKLFADGLD